MKIHKSIFIMILSIGIYTVCVTDIYQKYSNLATLNLMYSGARNLIFTYDHSTEEFKYQIPPTKYLTCDGPYSCLNNICELTKPNNYWIGTAMADKVNTTGCSNDYKTFLNQFDNYPLFSKLVYCSIAFIILLFLYSIIIIVLNRKYPNKGSYLIWISFCVITILHIPLWISYGIWYFDFYNKDTDTLPGNINLANALSTISIIILSIFNNFLYPMIIIIIKKDQEL